VTALKHRRPVIVVVIIFVGYAMLQAAFNHDDVNTFLFHLSDACRRTVALGFTQSLTGVSSRTFPVSSLWMPMYVGLSLILPQLYETSVCVCMRVGQVQLEMLRIPKYLGNRLTDGEKVLCPTHGPHCTPQKHRFSASSTHFCSRLSKPAGPSAAPRIRWIEKKSFTSWGLEPATFRLVAWCPNHQCRWNRILAVAI
jgi:hypothetical protein